MPTYQYACTACDDRLEVVQKFSDDPLTECESCGGRLRKVFSPVGVVFKGSGFYRTDSRSASPTNDSSGTSQDKNSDSETASTETSAAKSSDTGSAEGTSASSNGSGSGSNGSGDKSAGSSDSGSKKATEKAA